jgi:hypothetical protein
VLKFFLVYLHFEYAKIRKNLDFTTYFSKKTLIFNITIIKILKINLCHTQKNLQPHRIDSNCENPPKALAKDTDTLPKKAKIKPSENRVVNIPTPVVVQ